MLAEADSDGRDARPTLQHGGDPLQQFVQILGNAGFAEQLQRDLAFRFGLLAFGDIAIVYSYPKIVPLLAQHWPTDMLKPDNLAVAPGESETEADRASFPHDSSRRCLSQEGRSSETTISLNSEGDL